MKLVKAIAELRTSLDRSRADGRQIGFVPTMGYLHDGHLSLIHTARQECDEVLVSIFVNPLQFGPGEDLAAYPRDLDRDAKLAEQAGVDLLFVPDAEEMYPQPMATTVSVAGVSEGMEGAIRPTHFAGVATVVAKLFSIVGPCRAYFGEKDFQQLQVVRRMVDDLSMPVTVVGCPTVREPDGLAMSSRNVYLSADERRAATVLYRALTAGAERIAAGATEPADVERAMKAVAAAEPLVELDYAGCVDPATLRRPDRLAPQSDVRLLVAARVGAARLIDNIGTRTPPVPEGDRTEGAP